jgi:hypothetical protein
MMTCQFSFLGPTVNKRTLENQIAQIRDNDIRWIQGLLIPNNRHASYNFIGARVDKGCKVRLDFPRMKWLLEAPMYRFMHFNFTSQVRNYWLFKLLDVTY